MQRVNIEFQSSRGGESKMQQSLWNNLSFAPGGTLKEQTSAMTKILKYPTPMSSESGCSWSTLEFLCCLRWTTPASPANLTVSCCSSNLKLGKSFHSVTKFDQRTVWCLKVPPWWMWSEGGKLEMENQTKTKKDARERKYEGCHLRQHFTKNFGREFGLDVFGSMLQMCLWHVAESLHWYFQS